MRTVVAPLASQRPTHSASPFPQPARARFPAHAKQIIESGSHDVLLAADGEYARMWNQQLRSKPGEEASDDKPAAPHPGPPAVA